MVQDIHTRTEKYHVWEKADGRSNIRTRKRKAPCKITSMQAEDNTSETDVPTGQGFRYPPQIFTDPTYAAAIPQMEEEKESEPERKFLGKYCKFCDRCGESHCWCNSSDWAEELLNTKQPDSTPSLEKTPSLIVRKPPMGWAEYRCRIVKAAE